MGFGGLEVFLGMGFHNPPPRVGGWGHSTPAQSQTEACSRPSGMRTAHIARGSDLSPTPPPPQCRSSTHFGGAVLLHAGQAVVVLVAAPDHHHPPVELRTRTERPAGQQIRHGAPHPYHSGGGALGGLGDPYVKT